jgi:hypothetical protein
MYIPVEVVVEDTTVVLSVEIGIDVDFSDSDVDSEIHAQILYEVLGLCEITRKSTSLSIVISKILYSLTKEIYSFSSTRPK